MVKLYVPGGVFILIVFKIIFSPVYVNEFQDYEVVVEDTLLQQPEKEYLAQSKTISHVTLTCYQPVKAQCNNDPLTTADGSKINLKKLKKGSIKWCAVSRDIEYLFPMGSTVKLTNETTGECLGYYEVHDRMNKRWDHRVDILIHPEDNQLFKHNNIKIERV